MKQAESLKNHNKTTTTKMSSKILKFEYTKETKAKQNQTDLTKMADISFITVCNTSDLYTDLQMLSPEDSIIQSLKNLMRLPVGGNVLFPERGEKVGDMLFAPGLTQNEAQTYIRSYIEMNEPRITIHNVTSSKKIDDFNEQIVTLNVTYSFKNSDEIYNAIVDLKSTLA